IWALDMYADLLGQLETGPDGQPRIDADGASTFLDNTVALWSGDNSDATTHGACSMTCVLGGRGGASAGGWRIRGGRQLRFGGCTPDEHIIWAQYAGKPYPPFPGERGWKDLLWGLMNIVGVPDPSDGKAPLKSFPYASHPLDQELV